MQDASGAKSGKVGCVRIPTHAVRRVNPICTPLHSTMFLPAHKPIPAPHGSAAAPSQSHCALALALQTHRARMHFTIFVQDRRGQHFTG